MKIILEKAMGFSSSFSSSFFTDVTGLLIYKATNIGRSYTNGIQGENSTHQVALVSQII